MPLEIVQLLDERVRGFVSHRIEQIEAPRGLRRRQRYLASSLIDDEHFAEARTLINETLPIARRVYGDAHDLTLGHRYMLPRSIVLNPDATQENLRVAKGELEDLLPTTRRIFGNSHPRVELVRNLLEGANQRLSSQS